ncbi:MAG: AAA family ATPase [Clostridia bacterium]|nr:AAA family ATPase [Clostridia bacterium]
MSKIISVISGKGGSGKTFVASNLAAGFNDSSSKTLLIDCSFGVRNSGFVLKCGADVLFNLGDVLSGTSSFDEAVIRSAEGFGADFLACSVSESPDMLYDGLKSLLESLKDVYDYIIIDTPSSAGIEFDVCTALSDVILAVTSPGFASASNTALALKRINEISKKEVYTVINMPYSYESDGYVEDVIDETGYRLIGLFTYDGKIPINEEQSVLAVFSDTYTSREFKLIVKRLKNEYVHSAKLSLSERLFEKIKSV